MSAFVSEEEAKAVLARRVSRETFSKLEIYVRHLTKWQHAINLVSHASLPHVWARHLLDSSQVLWRAPDDATTWLDMGSGAGFPGLICAALAAETRPALVFNLVEADLRKAAFLREAARIMGIRVGVFSRRIEDLPSQQVNVVSARALTALPGLCDYAYRHLAPGGTALFQKGVRYADELELARQGWHMDVTVLPSMTDVDAVILKIDRLSHA